ncbi:MAG: hypothetical protein NEHIOOID_00250 [Holosporales bacterium]
MQNSSKIIAIMSFVVVCLSTGFSENGVRGALNPINPNAGVNAPKNNLADEQADDAMDPKTVKEFIDHKKKKFDSTLQIAVATLEKLAPNDRVVLMTYVRSSQEVIATINEIYSKYPNAVGKDRNELYTNLAKKIVSLDVAKWKIEGLFKAK